MGRSLQLASQNLRASSQLINQTTRSQLWAVYSSFRGFADVPAPVTPSTSASATPAPAEAPKRFSFALPKFLRDMMPGSSGSQATASAKDKSKDEKQKEAQQSKKQNIEQLEKFAQGTVDGYQAYLVQDLLQREVPVFRQPPVPMWHYDYKSFVDMRWVYYLRDKQHKDICTHMMEKYKTRIEKEGAAVLKDVQFLRELASSLVPVKEGSKVPFTEYEVADCIWQLLWYKRFARQRLALIARHDADWDPDALSHEELSALTKRVQEDEAKEWYGRALLKRDPSACTLAAGAAFAGPLAKCCSTGLPYKYCCGGEPMPVKEALHYLEEEEGIGPADDTKMRPGRYSNKYLVNPVPPVVENSHPFTALPDRKDPRQFKDAHDVEQYHKLKLSKHRRGYKLNHLLPLPEGSPRQFSHEKSTRDAQRKHLQPKPKPSSDFYVL